MNEEIEIHLVIIDPALEQKTISSLHESAIEIHGRYLRIEDIELVEDAQMVLIVSAAVLLRSTSPLTYRSFYQVVALGECAHDGVISLSEGQISALPSILSALSPTAATPRVTGGATLGYQIEGITPRSGVTMVTDLLELKYAEELFVWRAKAREISATPRILVSEFDDYSLNLLFSLLVSDEEQLSRVGVVLNKIPNTRDARARTKAIERELRERGLPLVAIFFFDEKVQVTGQADMDFHRPLSSLFDWITKAN